MFGSNQKGFTFIEVLVAIAVIFILTGITVNSVGKAKEKKQIEAIADEIVSRLDQAHGNSVAGKNGSNYGVKFNSGSYVYFPGTTYISTNSNNEQTNIDPSFVLSNTIPGSDDYIVFSRITGDVGYTATVTVSHINGNVSPIDVVIGNLGEVSVVK